LTEEDQNTFLYRQLAPPDPSRPVNDIVYLAPILYPLFPLVVIFAFRRTA
jgi:hypothetical protein